MNSNPHFLKAAVASPIASAWTAYETRLATNFMLLPGFSLQQKHIYHVIQHIYQTTTSKFPRINKQALWLLVCN
jgi:hypothetical protein